MKAAFASSTINFDNARNQIQQQFDTGFKFWEANISHGTALEKTPPKECSDYQGDSPVRKDVLTLLTKMNVVTVPAPILDILELSFLCRKYLYDKTLACAILLSKLCVAAPHAADELKKYTAILIEETQKQKWHYGLTLHPFYQDQIDSELISNLWSIIEKHTAMDCLTILAQLPLAASQNGEVLKAIGGVKELVECLFPQQEAPAEVSGTDKAPTNTKLQRRRLELDEDRNRFRIDDHWYEYKGQNATTFLAMLLKAEGTWENGKTLLCVSEARLLGGKYPRSDRVLRSLPTEIQAIIESRHGGGGGYRIKPEYFELT